MASAVLASRNEPYWGERKDYLRKYTNTVTAAHSFLNRDPNPTPAPTPRQHSYLLQYPNNNQNHDPSINAHFVPVFEDRKPAFPLVEETKVAVHGRFVTFKLGAYTRHELKQLKKRLVSELEQIRSLKTRLETLSAETRPVKAKKGKKRVNSFQPDSSPKKLAMDPMMELLGSMMKRCGQILTKVMKLKFAWVFNNPVDVEGMGLFDYHQIIKKPMDLGTVKTNLGKGFYKSPVDFAADVRLTFENAMTYNPKEHDVHVMAKQLLVKFNEMYDPAYMKFENERLRVCGKSPARAELVKETPVVVEKVVQPVLVEKLVVPVVVGDVGGRMGKLPKPKARDPNKRAMNFDEKARLGKEMEELPAEKMMQLLQIVRKRNGQLAQNGDEIELDMEAMDVETLWELDRFVSNYKKMVNKIKRQGVLADNQNPPPFVDNQNNPAAASELVDAGPKGGVGEEDVDIGEDIPFGNYPFVEIEKDVTACARGRSSSSSESSSSDSSSSNDSDSRSSGSDSDAGSVRSPYVESNQAETREGLELKH